MKRHERRATKNCKTCSLKKPITEFYKMASGNPEASCKECKKIRCKTTYHADHEANKAKFSAYKRDWRTDSANKALDRVSFEKWRDKDLARYHALANEASSGRRKLIKQATPKWACKDLILEVYIQGSIESKEVDHIIPINNPLVCGLHVENNLQLLTKHENCVKSNKFVDDIV